MFKLEYRDIKLKQNNNYHEPILGVEVELKKIEDEKNKKYLKKLEEKAKKTLKRNSN